MSRRRRIQKVKGNVLKPDEAGTFHIPETEKVETLRISAPLGVSMLYSKWCGDAALKFTSVLTEELAACRMMMRGTPEEQEFARRNHSPGLVAHVEWEIEAERGNQPEYLLMLGAVDGDTLPAVKR